MARYANGRAPLSKMVHLGGNHYLPPGTAHKWKKLVARVQKEKGVTLRITPDRDGCGGWNGYRPLSAQKRYKRYYGNMAAAPGYSSHGLVYGGQQCAAIDVDNWQQVGWEYFKKACKKEGFRTDFVSPREQWHIGDFGDVWKTPKPKPKPKPVEELDMAIRAKSKHTGSYFIIFEHSYTKVTKHAQATAYTHAAKKKFPVLPSSEIQSMLADCKDRATAFYTALGRTDYVKQIQADLDKIIAEETAS